MNAICRGCPGALIGDCAHCDVLRERGDGEDYGEDGDREEAYEYGEGKQNEPGAADLEVVR